MSNQPVVPSGHDSDDAGQGVVNEFDQPVEGVSLTKDAWRRLKKNKMAMFGLVVVVIYEMLMLSASSYI